MEIAALQGRLADAASLAPPPPPAGIVTGFTKSLFKSLTNSADDDDEEDAKSRNGVFVWLDATLAAREKDLAKAKEGSPLRARIAEVGVYKLKSVVDPLLESAWFHNPQAYEVKNWFQNLYLQCQRVPLHQGG